MASVLIVDAANVVGSVPDGWWKDRAGAARRLHERLLVQGFDELATRMQTALARSVACGGRAMMLAAADAYVGFALANPGVFGVMFRREICNPIRFPEVRHAGARAHHELERLV